MKITSPEDSAYIIARLCSERFDNAAIKYYLQASPTARDFRNRFTAAFFRAFQEALQASLNENTLKGEAAANIAERFDAAREELERRADDFVYGFPWEAGKHRATLAAIAVLDAVRNLAQAYGAIRFDLYSSTQRPAQP